MKMHRLIVAALLLVASPAAAQWQTPNHSVPLGKGGGVTGFGNAAPGTTDLPFLSNGPAADPSFRFLPNAGLATMPANTVKGNATGGVAIPTDIAALVARGPTLLNIDEYTPHGDTNYSILATDRTVGTNAAFTAPRIWTLPAASSLNPGQTIIVADFFGGLTLTNTLTIARAGGDTVNGATTAILNAAFARNELRSDGVSKWSSSAAAAGVSGSQIVDLTKPPYNACTGSDDTAQIKLWLAAAASGGTTPGIAYVPPGTNCFFNIVLPIPSNTTLWGYGATFTELAGGNANTTFCACVAGQNALGPKNIYIYGLKVVGNVANRTGPYQSANFMAIAADDVHWVDTIATDCSGDCYNVTGNTGFGFSHRVYGERITAFASTTTGSATRNLITLDGVITAGFHHCWLQGAGAIHQSSPGAGIDNEVDAVPAGMVNSDVTTDVCNITGNSGPAINVNPGAVVGGVTVSQSMNIQASANNVVSGVNDFLQFTTPANKAGHRFINAHGTFGGTIPAVDALP